VLVTAGVAVNDRMTNASLVAIFIGIAEIVPLRGIHFITYGLRGLRTPAFIATIHYASDITGGRRKASAFRPGI
jgi:hypothetical protein